MSAGRWEFDENGNVHYVDGEGNVTEHTTDGAYHYSYRQPEKPAANHTPKRDNGWHWALIILAFIGIWPLGLVLLFLELTGAWPGSAKADKEFQRMTSAAKNAAGQVKQVLTQSNTQPYVDQRKQARAGAQPGNYGQTTEQVQERLDRERAQREQRLRENAARNDARKAEKAARKAKKKAVQDAGAPFGLGHVRLFRWIGGIMTGIFGFAFVMTLIDELQYFYSIGSLLSSTIPLLAFTLIGITLLGVAGSRKRKLKTFQKYLAMIGNRDRIAIAPLADAMGVSLKQADKDLEEMLERRFWDQGYVDAARQELVLGSPLEYQEEPEIDQEAVSPDDQAAATLRHIRQVNDAIADPDMTEKIARIEELSAKIFKLLEEKPEKAGELRSFMSYYLPQTLRILERYSELEAQGIEGENIAEAKGKIEGVMDKLVDGYETQLDKLFADDVMDISADLKVMEQMLEKDGLAMETELRF